MTFEESVAGGWSEPEHGAVLHRSPRRFASFAWRSFGLTTGLVLPPRRGDLAEWDQNLGGRVRFAGDPVAKGRLSRELVSHRITEFAGGFTTSGEVIEGRSLALDESWTGEFAARSSIAIAALPDDRTVVGFQRCTVGEWSPIVLELQGLHLGIPNDIFSGSVRQISTARGGMEVRSRAEDSIRSLGQWACVDDVLGVVGVFGAPELQLVCHQRRLGGRFESLAVDEIAFPARSGPFRAQPGTDLFDVGWVVLANADAAETAAVAASATADLVAGDTGVRAIRLMGADGRRYFIAANLGAETADLRAPGSPIVAPAEPGRLFAGEVVITAFELES